MVSEPRRRVTYFYERWRALSSGILETAATTFLLLIAVRWFEAGATAKALIAGGGSLGLILSPGVVSLVVRLGWRTSRAASVLAAGGSFFFLIMAAFPFLPVFAMGSVLAMTASSAAIPLMTQIYQENYPERRRGHFFSRTVMIRIGTAALFGELAGRALTGNLEYFQVLLLVFAAAFALASFCLARCPSRPLSNIGGTHPFRSMRFVRADELFRRTLICWMLMGFANLMMAPMRVEYLANPRYGLEMTVVEIAFLTLVLPNIARLVMSPLWGLLFDRMNFFTLRVTLNLGFALGIMAFFVSSSMWGLVLGALAFGISNAGGDVAWSLWVTKFAPPAHVVDYMSVHTFLTGIRGILAPLVAFHAVQVVGIAPLAWISAALIVAASLLLLPEIGKRQRGRQTSALVEEISE
jgi:MFS family permease